MPPPPEIRHGIGDVGIVEVFLIMKAAHQTHADGHVGIGRKIEVDLKHIGKTAQPHTGSGHGGERGLVRQQELVGNGGAAVGQNGLLREADGKARDAGAQVGVADAAVQNVLVDVLIAHDRPSDALVEQAGIEQQQPVFFLRLDLAAVNVDHIRQQLEGIERDADRQRDGRDDLRPAGQRLEVAEQEAGVFEDTEDDQHQRNADDHPELFLRFAVGRADAQRGEPADADHAE